MAASLSPVHVGVLGPLEVVVDDQALKVGGPKEQALLVLLALRAGRVVGTDTLFELLWGDDPPETATNVLRTYASRLRRVLPDGVLVSKGHGYVLDVPPDAVDALRFDRLVHSGRFADALALWRSDELARLGDTPLAVAETRRLTELRVGAVEAAFDADLVAGRHRAAVAGLESAVAAHPLRERLWELLALALYRSGRQGEALRVFARARNMLVDELGVEPGVGLRDLEAAVLAHDPRLDLAADAAPPTPTAKRLVGRRREVEMLQVAFADVVDSRGRLVLVSGDPGIGKTSLAVELDRQWTASNAVVVWGRCWEGGGAAALGPWVQVVRALWKRRADLFSSRLASHLPHLARLVPEVGVEPVSVESSGEQARFALYEAIVALLDVFASDGPIVVVLDDLHAADQPSLGVLEFVARELHPLRLLVVGTHREAELRTRPDVAHLLSGLAREHERLPLRGLSPEDVATLVDREVGAVAPSVTAAVSVETGGNPFFVRELVRLLAAEDRLSNPGSRLGLPAGVRETVCCHLATVSPGARAALEAGAVVGTEFSVSLVAAALDRPVDSTLDGVGEARGAGLVIDVNPGRVRFAHALVRETLYEELAASQRARLHAAIGTALERLGPLREADTVAALGHHFSNAISVTGASKAITYLTEAADVASAKTAFAEAARLLDQALDLVDPGDEQRGELLLRLGTALARASRPDEARVRFLAAADFARRRDPSLLAEATVAYQSIGSGTVFAFKYTGVDQSAIDLLNEALAIVDAPAPRARLLASVAAELFSDTGRLAERTRIADEALAVADSTGDDDTIATTLAFVAIATLPPGLRDVDGRGKRLVAYSRRLDRPEAEAIGLAVGVLDGLARCDRRAADQTLSEMFDLARRTGLPGVRWITSAAAAGIAASSGQLDEAEAKILAALDDGQRHGDPNPQAHCGSQLVTLDLVRNLRLDPDFARAFADSVRMPLFECFPVCGLALAGRYEEAMPELTALSASDVAWLPRDGYWLMAMHFLATTCSVLRAEHLAGTYRQLLLPFADYGVSTGMAGFVPNTVPGLLAGLAGLEGDWTEAEGWYAEALRLCEGLQMPMTRSDAQWLYGSVLLERGPSRSRGQARSILGAALDTATAAGATGRAERIQADLDASAADERVLATVLSTDIVSSTERAANLGDAARRRLLDRHDATVRRLFAHHAGREVLTRGDEFLATFDRPAGAVRCALAVRNELRAAGIEIRSGVHTGEVTPRGDDISGIAVHVAARVRAMAEPGEVLVTSTVVDLVTGSGLAFADRGACDLKGVPGEWRLYAAS